MTATVIWLTKPYYNTRRRVIADSWFSSVKSAVELLKRGLYGIMLVKTAHNQFSKHLLGQSIDDHKVQACQFRDLKLKDYSLLADLQLLGNPERLSNMGWFPVFMLRKNISSILHLLMSIIIITYEVLV